MPILSLRTSIVIPGLIRVGKVPHGGGVVGAVVGGVIWIAVVAGGGKTTILTQKVC
jgi:hypothetical protein